MTTDLHQRITDIVKELDLDVDHVIINEQGNYYFSLNKHRGKTSDHHYYVAEVAHDGGLYILKVRIYLPTDPGVREIIKNNSTDEQAFYNHFSRKVDFIPELIKHGNSDGLEWIVYRYVEGNCLGGTFLPNIIPTDPGQISKTVISVSSLTVPENLKLKKHGSKYYKKRLVTDLRINKNIIANYLSESEQKMIFDYFSECEQHLDSMCKYICHGDLHPGNIIINPHSAKIIDWETVHINNPVFDTALLWVRAWNLPELRKHLLNSLFNAFPGPETKKVFLYVIFHCLIGDISYWHGLKEDNDSNNPYTAYTDVALEKHKIILNALLNNPSAITNNFN